MVAPHDTGDLVRSLVRVPGSGSNRAAGSECLDLGRASSLAASVPVPTTLPAALATPKVVRQPFPSVNKKLIVNAEAGILPAKPEDRKRQHPGELLGSETSVSKRQRVFTVSQASQLVSGPSQLVPGPVMVLSLQSQTSSTPTIKFSGAESLSQLIKERDTLRKENQELQKRLSLFHQLFKDKKRLTSVVKRLGVNVPE